MQRRHLIELHEQSWYPAPWRKLFQDGLGRCLPMMGAFENLSVPLARFFRRTRAESILDLCSGSAEPIVALSAAVGSTPEGPAKLRVFVSDLYPNLEEFQKHKQRYPELVDYIPGPVNALQPPADAPRIRTMLNALHHFRPHEVESILQDAAENADGIAVVEATGRSWRNMLATLPLPLVAAFITVFLLRPFRFRNLLWGLLVPVIPFTALFDGLVSNLRTYTVDELRQLTAKIDAPDFEWEVGTVEMPKTRLPATYLLGWRRNLSPA